MVGDKKSNLKHFCKICKKGFGCGRALGGHMRAHGIGDESGAMDDDDEAVSDWEDSKLAGDANDNVSPSNKRMYALRANPNRLKSCRACDNCGKVFACWKSFLEHGKCSSDDAVDESFISSPGSDGDDMSGGRAYSWSKKKRSFRAKIGSFNDNNPNCSSSNEDEDLANCLMMLSNHARDSSPLASKEEERRNPNWSVMTPMTSNHNNKAKQVGNNNNSKGLFECKACKKVFNSHQALGGHRASHKKVKGCFAARLDDLDEAGTGAADDEIFTEEDQLFPTNESDNNNSTVHLDHGSNHNNAPSSKRKSKVHECSICHRVFTSGQALGGHKRCHWITSNAPDTSTLARFQQFQDQIEQHMKNNNPFIPNDNKFAADPNNPIHPKLDLNQPALPTARNVSTEMYLQSWVGDGGGVAKQHKDDKSQSHQHHHLRYELDNDRNDDEEGKNSNRNLNISKGSTMKNVVEDKEADSKVKLAKLSEDDVGGSSLPWLQVGIGSTTPTTDVGTGP